MQKKIFGKNTTVQNNLGDFKNNFKEEESVDDDIYKKENPYDQDCPLCHGTGRIVVIKDGHSYAKSCKCREEVIFKRRLKKSNIPKEYWNLADEEINEGVKALAVIGDKKKKIDINKFIKKYVSDFEANIENKKNILLIGTNGVGKTLASTKIAIKALKDNYKVKYTTSKNLIRLCGMVWDDNESKEEFDRLKEADFLVLDEYGKEYHSDNSWVYTELEDFLNYRFSQNKITIIATNFSDVLENKEKGMKMEVHQKSIISRLKGMTLTIKLGIKEDYRLQMAENMWADFDIDEIEE
jgi:DNA replication protein DnaC